MHSISQKNGFKIVNFGVGKDHNIHPIAYSNNK